MRARASVCPSAAGSNPRPSETTAAPAAGATARRTTARTRTAAFARRTSVARPTSFSTAAVPSGLPSARPHGHEGAAGPVEGETGGGEERPAQRKGRGAGNPEGGNRLEGEEADAEPGAVARAPDRERQLVLPALGHLPARLGKRQRKDARFAECGEERERGGARSATGRVPMKLPTSPSAAPSAAEATSSREGEEREGEALTGAAPAHGGSEGLDHGEASGRPGAGDSSEERGRRESGCDG